MGACRHAGMQACRQAGRQAGGRQAGRGRADGSRGRQMCIYMIGLYGNLSPYNMFQH